MWCALLGGAQLSADEENVPQNQPPTIVLTVSPAAEPVPAMKYRLLPMASDQTVGNAALSYYRAAVEFAPNEHNANYGKFAIDKVEPWLRMPLTGLPQSEVANALTRFDFMFRELERGALRDHCDWELPIAADGVAMLLPEFQHLRQPAKLLALRARLQMAAGDIDGSIQSLRANYQLARNMGKGGMLISSLVGIAIVSITRDQIETFVQQPNAPNLYWALSDLPVPLIDLRYAFEVEAKFPEYQFPDLKTFRSRTLSREEARRLSDRMLERWIGVGMGDSAPRTLEAARVQFAASALRNFSEAKRALIEAGRSKAEVEAMPVEQVLWLASDRHWQVYLDDMLKWVSAPAPQRIAGLAVAERRLGQFAAEHRVFGFEFADLIPGTGQALAASDRTQRQIALLQIEEAIRLHLHSHKGQLPESLDDITVPIPLDARTGKPFVYRLKGTTAVLEAPPVLNNRYEGRRYIIQVRN